MRRLVLILAFLPLLLVPTATHTIMLPVLGGKGPSVSLVASYNFENGADLGDDTTGTNDLDETSDPAQDADEKEGNYSCIFDGNDRYILPTLAYPPLSP